MPLRIVVAPQSFKGSVDARDVALAIAEGLLRVWPDAAVERIPVADGGEGTVRALVEAANGVERVSTVRDPLGRPVQAAWGVIDSGATAVIEMAAASGLPRLLEGERDVMRASSYGAGELLREAAHAGVRRGIVGLGGSATNDAGSGMLRALGLRFVDESGADVGEGGAALARVARIEGELDPAVRRLELLVASDVRNPLTGPEGASAIFGPQKGATADQVRTLDAALAHFADVVARRIGRDVRNEPGAGAAGGAGFALRALLDAEIRSGAELVLEAARFDERIQGAQLCVTGEGRLDGQSVFGKASVAVTRHARRAGVLVVAVVGALGPGYERTLAEGIAAVAPIATGPSDLATLIREGPVLISASAERLARAVQVGRELGTVSR
ncbi:MAG TPA: glycerate kinase [Candidatus Limnocylindria bacterium]|nr:glycerate kinase [Candidatus Limnocylindria bacterium]